MLGEIMAEQESARFPKFMARDGNIENFLVSCSSL
jgi:hypothetical protein